MKIVVCFVFVLAAFSAAAKVIVTKPGKTVVLKCEVDTYRNILVWNQGNDMIYRVIRKSGFTTRGKAEILKKSRVIQEKNLEISKVTLEDAGKFICTADGNVHEHTLVVVSVWASPSTQPQLGTEVTLRCQVNGLTPGPAVQWTRPGGGLASEPVELRSVARSDAGTWVCSFSHDGVSHTESLEVTVQDPPPETPAPEPTQGSEKVPKPPCQNCNVPGTSDAPQLELLGLSWWIWVAVGLGCLVVVLLIVLVIVLCKRIKRKKRKLEMMKNGRKPRQPRKYCQCNRTAAAAKPQQGRRGEKPSALPLQPLLME